MGDWHVISCEYPPQVGGVSSYVSGLGSALAQAGQQVHVWCPAAAPGDDGPVAVHGGLGRFRPIDLRRAGRALDTFPGPRRLLVQWVPHGYGYRSMNLPFCFWIRERARRGDLVELMVHEPFLSFSGSCARRAAAAVHRVMTLVLLRAAHRVWLSTPAWRGLLEPFAPARELGFGWLPIPSPVGPVEDPRGVLAVRTAAGGERRLVVGHFGLYSRLTAEPVTAALRRLLRRVDGAVALLMGAGSARLRAEVLRGGEDLAPRVHASGVLRADDLSRHLQACDLVVQPYPDGVTGRRTSTMAPLAHGVAVVTTEGALSEPVWRERGAVRLVPAGDIDGLVTEAERLLHDEPARRQLGARGRQLHEERFAFRHTVAALLGN